MDMQASHERVTRIMYCKVWKPNTSLLKISGAIALHNNKHDLKTSGVIAQDNKHKFSKSIFHLNCQLYADSEVDG